MEFVQRIEAITGLGIFQSFASLNEEPEVGELIGKITSLGTFNTLERSCSNDESSRMFLIGFQEERNIFRLMLTIRI